MGQTGDWLLMDRMHWKYCHPTCKARPLKETQHPPDTQSLFVSPSLSPSTYLFRAPHSHIRRTTYSKATAWGGSRGETI